MNSSASPLDASFFTGNRVHLRKLFTGTAPVVITAHGQLQQGSDEAFPFHQDRNFLYLTGVNEPGVILVMDKGKEYLIVPHRDQIIEQFDGVIDHDALRRTSGVQEVVSEKEGWSRLKARLKRSQSVATLGAAPRYIEFLGLYTNPARADLIQKLKDINPHLEVLDLRTHLSRLRMVKQAPELEAIQHAIDTTIAGLKEVMRPSRLAKYAYEYEIEADLSRSFRRTGLMGHAFPPIVASGQRACTLHHMLNNAPLATGELLLLDVGAQADYYAADLTRTVVLGGHASRRQQLVHEAVKEAQDYAYSLLKPGVVLRQYEKQMEAFMGEKLRELGLIKSITREDVRRYFPNATSHFLGLDTHDAGDYEQPLEPGAVLTVEPGIYIPDEAIGVRIEDDILITEDGMRTLSGHLSRELV